MKVKGQMYRATKPKTTKTRREAPVSRTSRNIRGGVRSHAAEKAAAAKQEPPQRIHKLLANAGFGSRRTIEEWIKQQRIQVNGVPATIGQIVSLTDQIEIDSRRIDLLQYTREATRVLLYNKPEGEICSHRSVDGKKTVYDNLPKLKQGKWISVGRLDVNTSGLLLFTNDGDLAHRLMHPSFGLERHYLVRVLGKVTPDTIRTLKEGVKLEAGFCQFKEIYQKENESTSANQWFIVTLMEGKYREVRKLWESQGCTVSRLVRIRYGEVELPRRLRKGDWQELPEADLAQLYKEIRKCANARLEIVE